MVALYLSTVPELTISNVLKALNQLKEAKWAHLGKGLLFPRPKCIKVAKYRLKSKIPVVVRWWLNNHPFPSWGNLVTALDEMHEDEIVSSIRHYADHKTPEGLSTSRLYVLTLVCSVHGAITNIILFLSLLHIAINLSLHALMLASFPGSAFFRTE